MQIKKLDKTDTEHLKQLSQLYKDVFEIAPTKTSSGYFEDLLQNKAILFFVAIKEMQVRGGLTAHILHNVHSEKPEVFIYDIAVNVSYQRKGIGKLLMQTLFNYCRKRNYKEIFVPALKEDTHALNFYRSLGG